MAARTESTIRAQFDAFTKQSHLNVLLPKSDDFDAIALLRAGSPEEIQRAPTRKHLFFDERTKLQIVLRVLQSEDEVRSLLKHLEIAIAAHATNAVPEGSGNAASASGKHDVVSSSLSASEGVELATVGDHTYAVWKPILHLVRPKARLQRPAIYFTANLSPTFDSVTSTKYPEEEFLPSYEPLPANVLEPLQHDPSQSTGGRGLFLPETRVTKVSPSAAQTEDSARPLRGATKRAFPAVPALFTRMSYSTLPDAVVASLQLETSQLIAGDIRIDEIKLEVPDAKVEGLNDAVWPQQMHAGDEIVLLYKLVKQYADSTPASQQPMEMATVSLKATAFLEQGSRIDLETQWQAQVDLTQPASATSYKWSRPLSANLGAHKRLLSQESSRPSSHEISRMPTRDGEVVFTFTSSKGVTKGSEFRLGVQCVNMSNRSRRFALAPVQGKHISPAATRQSHGEAAGMTTAKWEQATSPDALVLTPDVRIGPLTAGSCYETSLKYRAVNSGVLELGIVRVIDLESRQTIDVAELPDIMAQHVVASE